MNNLAKKHAVAKADRLLRSECLAELYFRFCAAYPNTDSRVAFGKRLGLSIEKGRCATLNNWLAKPGSKAYRAVPSHMLAKAETVTKKQVSATFVSVRKSNL